MGMAKPWVENKTDESTSTELPNKKEPSGHVRFDLTKYE